jgi:hypothetical protein
MEKEGRDRGKKRERPPCEEKKGERKIREKERKGK